MKAEGNKQRIDLHHTSTHLGSKIFKPRIDKIRHLSILVTIGNRRTSLASNNISHFTPVTFLLVHQLSATVWKWKGRKVMGWTIQGITLVCLWNGKYQNIFISWGDILKLGLLLGYWGPDYSNIYNFHIYIKTFFRPDTRRMVEIYRQHLPDLATWRGTSGSNHWTN